MIRQLLIYISIIASSVLSIPVRGQVLPRLEVTIHNAQTDSGYYFLHPFRQGSSAIAPTNMILDEMGELVYFRSLNRSASDFQLTHDGRMSYGLTPVGPATSKFYVMDSTFLLSDSVQCRNGIFTDTHDMQILSNGHYLMLGYTNQTMDLSSYPWFSGNGSPGSSSASVKGGVIQELDQNKNIVLQWSSFDHFQFSDVQEEWLSDPNTVDWTHCNSVAEDTDGNFLLSSRWFSEITKINRTTGQVMWRFGGKRNQFTFVNDPYSGFVGQHDARRLANGNLTLLDNGRGGARFHPARALEYTVNESTKIATLVWSATYSPSAFSSAIGNVQRLANGNSLVTWGIVRNSNVVFDVLRPDGSVAVRVQSPDTAVTYRAHYYPELPWELHRPSVRCFTSGANAFLEVEAEYNSYLWSNGATTRTIQITSPGTYSVFVPYGQGGFISSPRKIIVSLTNPCDEPLDVDDPSTHVLPAFRLEQNYPNPFNPSTTIEYVLPQPGRVRLEIVNPLGEIVRMLVDETQSAGRKSVHLDGSSLGAGVYFCRLIAGTNSQIRKLVLLK